MPNVDDKIDMIAIANRFYENIYALRIFNEQIGQFAEEYDELTRDRFIKGLADLAGISRDEINISSDNPFTFRFKINDQIPEHPLIDSPIEINPTAEIIEQQNAEITKEEIPVEAVIDQEIDNIKNPCLDITNEQQFIQIIRYLHNSKKYNPRQSKLLRQGALISLISYFESLEVDLLQFFYINFPGALPSDGKLLSLADLREIGSIDEAERILITKEIDGLLRETTEAQIDYFTKRPRVDLKCLDCYMDSLLEIIQRRNLFVHNNGFVNKIYLNKLRNKITQQYDLKEGDELTVEGEYLSHAIDSICVCGTMLIQQSWRKWDEKSIEDADNVFREYTYDLLLDKRWDLVDKLATYASNLHFESDSSARVIIINQAIALKELDKLEEMESLLQKKDWSSCALKFHLALHILRDQKGEMIHLLRKAVAAGEIDKEDIDEWPLFKWLRECNDYQDIVSQIFPKSEPDKSSSGCLPSPS